MSTGARRLVIGGGVVILIIASLTIRCTFNWFEPARRVPREIPLGQLVETQQEALGPQWSQRDNVSLNTDSDFTSGVWAILWGFDHVDYRHNANEEIHTFYNLPRAERNKSPSPGAIYINKDGNPPPGWNYIPPHADRFVIDCRGETVIESCAVLLRYQEYAIVYYTNVADATTLEDLRRLLVATDEFMYDYLSSTTLEPGRREVPTLDELGLSK